MTSHIRIETADLRNIGGPLMGPRLAELGSLKDGWLDDDGGGRAASPEFLHFVAAALAGLIERVGTDRPYLFLLPDGGVEALWKDEERSTSLYFAATGRVSGVAVDRVGRRAELLAAQPMGDLVDQWLGTQVRIGS